jgi:hypothetical protein
MWQGAGGAGLFLTGLILSAEELGLRANAGTQTHLSNMAHPLLAAALGGSSPSLPLTACDAIMLSALPVGFFGVLFGFASTRRPRSWERRHREHRSERRNNSRNLFHGRHGAAVMGIVRPSDGSMERKI